MAFKIRVGSGERVFPDMHFDKITLAALGNTDGNGGQIGRKKIRVAAKT